MNQIENVLVSLGYKIVNPRSKYKAYEKYRLRFDLSFWYEDRRICFSNTADSWGNPPFIDGGEIEFLAISTTDDEMIKAIKDIEERHKQMLKAITYFRFGKVEI